MTKRAFRNRYSKIDHEGILFTQPSLTEQSAFDDVNIHSLVNRGMNNLKPNTMKPLYGVDVSSLPEYQESLQIVADAKNAFEAMPVELREKFHNNPEEFLQFVDNKEENYDEGVKLGIFSPNDKPSKPLETVVPDAPSVPKIDPSVITGDSEKIST